MKQFLIILAAILVAAGIIFVIWGVYDAKQHHDEFNAKMQQFQDDTKKTAPENSN